MNNRYISGKYDPFEINSIWFHEQSSLRDLVPKKMRILSTTGFFLYGLFVLLKIILKSLDTIITEKEITCRWNELNKKRLFFTPTSNNQKAVSSVIDLLRQEKEGYIIIDKAFDIQYYPMLKICLYSLKYLPWFTRHYKLNDDSDKRVILFNLSFFLLTPGVTRFYATVLKNVRPECVVFANDHMSYCRNFALVCEDYGIRTIYVQHASVSSAFPELIFTHSFLDGMDSLVKYTEKPKDSRGEVILLGALRYDPLSKYRVNRINYQRHCIGIAINDLDNNDVANKFCNALLRQYPDITLKVRSHPALKNNPFVFDNKDRIKYTCATDESITDYFDSIDLQISGDSGVHFDAIIGGVPTLVYNFSSNPFLDNYKYVEKGLIKFASTNEDVFKLIDTKEIDVNNDLINYYDASYGKSYAGNCSKIVAEFIINGYEMSFLKDAYGLEKGELGNNTFYIIPR